MTKVQLGNRQGEHPEFTSASVADAEPAFRWHPSAQRSAWDLFAALLCLGFIAYVLISILVPKAAHADETALLRRGDAAVTAYSGTHLASEVAPGVAPLDRTFLDTTAPTLKVFDLSKLGGDAGGQVANAPVKFSVPAQDIGQVFGVALDSDTSNRTPNVYVTSTSLYGLQIVDKNGERILKGEPGARWMPGQFGLAKGGGPGSVWKIDGATGAVSLLANIKHDGRENAGPGLGGIAFDPVSQQLFVTDLETGLLHRLGLDGADKGTFDHGVTGRAKAGLATVAYDVKKRMSLESGSFDIENPATWGFADKRRRVVAVTVQNGRAYYSVADGPVIWSVGIIADGSFADDARFEIDVTGTPAGNMVTAIAFDGANDIYLAQRGEITGSYDYTVFAKPQTSAVLRYRWDESSKTWSDGADELPVGLEPPHRSTVGGVALSYGYDSTGSIDLGRCRESLWVVGEHLREGDTGPLAGGARNVHGLQGSSKSLAKPALISQPIKGSIALEGGLKYLGESANEPPHEAWFIDYDDSFDDADAFGHVGAIAIFNPCDKRVAAEEPRLPSLPPSFPMPGSAPGIYISKHCLPGPIGGAIPCAIAVANVGITSPPGPVTFSDFSTILAGPGAGGAVPITSAAPDGPDWFCTPTPTSSLSCALPAASLPPGALRSVTVLVDTAPLFAAGNHGFRNCAALGAPYAGIACDEGATDITVTKTAPASCMPGMDCTFGLTITNSGTSPFSGNVLLTDSMFVAGAPAAAPITAIVPALACAPAPVALPFSCTAPLALAPAESRVFAITVTMPAAPANYWARNCFAASAPGQPAPALPPAPGLSGTATSCAWVPVGAPGPLSNLSIKKTPIGCDKLDPDNVRCDYEIAIKNDGPSDFNAPLTFTETMPPSGVLSAVPAPWACAPGPPAYACTQPGAVAIAAGALITIPVSIDIPRVPLEAAKCWAPNTAAITAPVGGTDLNFEAADDSATTTADAALIRFEGPGGLEIVLCDPTNLKVTKTSMGDCAKTGDRFRCEYLIKATNTGPDPHKGDIKIKDTFGIAPAAVSFSAPWGCTPGGASFECTYPNASLAKGESVELKVTADVPDNGRCTLENTAAMTFPPANTRWNSDAADDTASASAKIPSSRCEKPESCGPEQVRNRDGRCVSLPTPPKLCADGSLMPRSGFCRCPFGTFRNRATGACVPVCVPGPHEVRTLSGQCVCRLGFVRREGRCLPWIAPKCTPGPDEYRTEKGQCVCKEGYERNRHGRCVKPEPPKCSDGSPMPRSKVCPCPEGTRRDPNTGQCGPLIDECASLRQRGMTLPPKCKPTPAEECKAKGWIWRNNECARPSDPSGDCKAKGWLWRNNQCVEPSNPADECKKKGGKWNGKTCDVPPSPAETCSKRGGKWDGKTCVMPPSPAEACAKRGGKWDGKTCVLPPSPAEACAKRGGKWNGKTCVMPPSPAEECKKKGGTWTGKRCIVPPKKCPEGMTGTLPNCKKIEKPKCPTGMTGTPPNCKKVEINKTTVKPLQLQQLQRQQQKP